MLKTTSGLIVRYFCIVNNFMPRKVLNISVVILLVLATGGLPITRHYCGRVQRSIAFFVTPKSCCETGCDKCHNVFKFTKVNDLFETGSKVSTQDLSNILLAQASYFIDLSFSVYHFPLSSVLIHRADFNLKAGSTPASFGNFRC
jgi:hypothetical protein